MLKRIDHFEILTASLDRGTHFQFRALPAESLGIVPSDLRQPAHAMRLGLCIALGIGIGTAVGAATDHLAMGVALGVAFGTAFGAFFGRDRS